MDWNKIHFIISQPHTLNDHLRFSVFGYLSASLFGYMTMCVFGYVTVCVLGFIAVSVCLSDSLILYVYLSIWQCSCVYVSFCISWATARRVFQLESMRKWRWVKFMCVFKNVVWEENRSLMYTYVCRCLFTTVIMTSQKKLRPFQKILIISWG